MLIHMKIQQTVHGSSPPEIDGQCNGVHLVGRASHGIIVVEFNVGTMEGVHVGVHGLGPFNWLAKKVVLGVVHQNISQV